MKKAVCGTVAMVVTLVLAVVAARADLLTIDSPADMPVGQINPWQPDTSFASITMYSLNGVAGPPKDPAVYSRALVKFNLSGLGGGKVIVNSAIFYAYSGGALGNFQRTFSAHRLTTDWTPGQATWNRAAAGIPWTNVGGDFLVAPTDEVPGSAWQGLGLDLATDVQFWHDHPAQNYGWLMHWPEDPSANIAAADFNMIDYQLPNPTNQFGARLVIDYTPIPEPASVVLLALAGLAVRRRR